MVGGVTCPNCGKDNPDFLDNCQFCQAVLRIESSLNIGENPTKKSTGELEQILPDWLREARQQGRDSAEEEAKKEATKPRIEKVEPPDLLAGLAFQAASDEDEVPDWLTAINPMEKKASAPSKPAEEGPVDFFAQFNQPAKESTVPAPEEISQNETPSWMAGSIADAQKDELAGWLPQASDSQEPAAAWAEPEKPAEPEDLSWLHELESSTKKKPETPATTDMDWMASLDASSVQPSGAQDDLSWLNNLGGTTAPSFNEPTPAQPASSQEDLSWLTNLGGTPAPLFNEPEPAQPAASQEDLSWLNNLGGTPAPSFNEPEPAQPASSQEDLSWLNNLGGTPAPSFNEPEPAQPAASQEDLSWLNNLGSTPTPSFKEPESAQPASSEDLDWLNNLGGTPMRSSFDESAPAHPTSSQEDLDWLSNLSGMSASSFNEPASAQPASSQEDLSWLNNLGSMSAPSFNEPTPAQPASSQEDLDWLSNLGGTSAPSFDEPTSAQPASSEDLDWLNNLGGTPAPSFNEPALAQPASSQEDLSWLNNLGSTSAPSFNEPAPGQPASSQEDLGWLSNLGSVTPTPSSSEPAPFVQPEETDWLKKIDSQQSILSPRHTAPLSEEAVQSMPDWLRSATEESSMPPLGATSMDWLASKDKTADDSRAQSGISAHQTFDQTQGTSASVDKDIFATSGDASSLSNQDIDSLFAVDMPDWLSQSESTAGETSGQENLPSEASDALAPVNLPSWVQAMRPVASVIGEASVVTTDQNTEKEGPLAGLRGVIPFAPIGSALRPKSISLKLQASDEQLASASLLEQILASETTVRPLKAAPFVAAQRMLRWALSGVFLIVLGAMLGLGTKQFPVSAVLPVAVSNAANVVITMPDEAPVLVVVDYEPALSGEMEAAAGPLLDQMTVLHRPTYSFISTSPNGAALVERLMVNTKISQPVPDGLGYQAGSQYFNFGYLPGGSAGVRGFTEQPKIVLPAVNVNLFSDYAVVIVITDHAESGQVWIEQLEQMKQTNPAFANQPLLVVASAQASPLLQPYVLSKQVAGMIAGLSDAARFEFVNNSRPGIARSYWDAFGVGLFMAILAIVLGSLWSLFAGIRARRVEAEQG